MPAYVGRVGAISAANRRSKKRASATRAATISMTKFTPPSRTPDGGSSSISQQSTAARDEASCDSVSCSSNGSKLSILSQLKNQVQETSVFFKKCQKEAANKAARGYRVVADTASSCKDASVKMRSSSYKDASVYDVLDNSRAEARASATFLDPAWVSTLEQMGFDLPQIKEAVASLGGQPSQIEDLLQVLLVMQETKASTTRQGTVAETLPSVSSQTLSSSSGQPNGAQIVSEASVQSPPLPPPLSPPPALSPEPLETQPLSAFDSVECEMAAEEKMTLDVETDPEIDLPSSTDSMSPRALEEEEEEIPGDAATRQDANEPAIPAMASEMVAVVVVRVLQKMIVEMGEEEAPKHSHDEVASPKRGGA